MTDQTLKEVIKSFAYGIGAEDVAKNYDLSVTDVEKIKTEHAAAIAAKKDELTKMGMM